MSHTSKTINSAKGIRFGEKKQIFCKLTMGEREGRERKRSKTYFSYLRRFVGQNSLSQELKFTYSTKSMHMYQNCRISPKIQKRKFGGNQGLWVKRPSQGFSGFSMLQEVGVLPTLVNLYLRAGKG